jgi:hypothetical protein
LKEPRRKIKGKMRVKRVKYLLICLGVLRKGKTYNIGRGREKSSRYTVVKRKIVPPHHHPRKNCVFPSVSC